MKPNSMLILSAATSNRRQIGTHVSKQVLFQFSLKDEQSYGV